MDAQTLEKLQRIYDKADSFGKQLMEKEFPELKESDDEKTKRMLDIITYKMSQHQPDIFTGEENEWFKAWLEKQAKEDRWTNEDENMLNAVLETESLCIENTDVDDEGTKARFGFEKEINWLKSIKQRLTSTMKE